MCLSLVRFRLLGTETETNLGQTPLFLDPCHPKRWSGKYRWIFGWWLVVVVCCLGSRSAGGGMTLAFSPNVLHPNKSQSQVRKHTTIRTKATIPFLGTTTCIKQSRVLFSSRWKYDRKLLLFSSQLDDVPVKEQDHNNRKYYQQPNDIPNNYDPFGPPPNIHRLKVGGEPFIVPRKLPDNYNHENNKSFVFDGYSSIQRVCNSPHVFVIRNLLTQDECQHIQQQVTDMRPADTTEGDGMTLRRNSRVAWLDNYPPPKTIFESVQSNDEQQQQVVAGATTTTSAATINNYSSLPGRLGTFIGNLLLTDTVKSSPGAGCEKLQVVHYSEDGGEFVLHHDGIGRILTVLYYLNGVAGTWFPLADMTNSLSSLSTETATNAKMFSPNNNRIPQNREEALEMVKNYQPGDQGLLVVGANSPYRLQNVTNTIGESHTSSIVIVQPGDAIAFYNYYSMSTTNTTPNSFNNTHEAADWTTLHAGLPTTPLEGDKWIANHWMHAPSLFRTIPTLFSTQSEGE